MRITTKCVVFLGAIFCECSATQPANVGDDVVVVSGPPNIADVLGTGVADGHLVPERTHRDQRYWAMVRAVLGRGFSDDVHLRMLCLPSFSPEWVTGVRRVAATGHRFVFVERATGSIWSAHTLEKIEEARREQNAPRGSGKIDSDEGNPQGPEPVQRMGTEYHEQPIDSGTVDLLERIWSLTLSETRRPAKGEGKLGLDGVSYYFWNANLAPVTGRTWSPEKGSRMAALVEIGVVLATIAVNNASKGEAHIQTVRRLAEVVLDGDAGKVIEPSN